MVTVVTGGTGFVGSNIVKELASRGHEVVCLDVSPADSLNLEYLGDLASRVSFVTGSILNTADLDALRESYQIEKIVHAAVFTVNREDLETARSKDIVDINVTGTANMLEMARLIGPERFVYISSGSIYGLTREPDQICNEDDAPRPDDLYGMTKLASEAVARRYGQLHGFRTVSLRLTTSYGPMERVSGHRDTMSTPCQWTGKMLRGEPIVLDHSDFGRDYTYVLDLASAIATVLDAPELPHHAYNVTNGVWVTGGEIQRKLAALFPETQLVDADPDASSGAAFAALRPTRGPLSGYRLWHDFRWTPDYDLTDGLTHYVRWRQEFGFLD